MVSEASERGSESGKRSDDRRGAARGTRAGSWSPQEGGASSHLAARLPPRSPGSFAAADMTTRTASLGLPRQAGAQRGRIDTYGERPPPVDREHRNLVPVRGREGGVRVDVDQREGEREVARHPLARGPQLAPERAVRPPAEGELAHSRRLTLRRPTCTDTRCAEQSRA